MEKLVKKLIDFILPFAFMGLLLYEGSESYNEASFFIALVLASGFLVTSLFLYLETKDENARKVGYLFRLKNLIVMALVFLVWVVASMVTDYGRWQKSTSGARKILEYTSCKTLKKELDLLDSYKKSKGNDLPLDQKEHLFSLESRLNSIQRKLCENGFKSNKE